MSLSLAKDEHQRLVRKLMEHFEDDMGLIVTCACSGYVNCEKTKSFEPKHIFRVVKCRSQNDALVYMS